MIGPRELERFRHGGMLMIGHMTVHTPRRFCEIGVAMMLGVGFSWVAARALAIVKATVKSTPINIAIRLGVRTVAIDTSHGPV